MFSTSLAREEIKKRQEIFLSLPKSLKETITSEETADKFYNISWGQYKLKRKQQRIVSFTAGEIMLGIIELNEFSNILKKRLEIDQATAEKIAQDINKQIFQPVMASLTKVQQEASQKSDSKPAISRPSTASKSKNENIVDLKNLPRE